MATTKGAHIKGLPASEENKPLRGYTLRATDEIRSAGIAAAAINAFTNNQFKNCWASVVIAQELVEAGPRVLNSINPAAYKHVMYLCELGLIHHNLRALH